MPRNHSENKLGEMPVGRLIISMSVPMILSMFIQALYNVVDSIFVARLEEDALTAVSLAFPVMSVMIAIGVGTSVGLNAFVSRSLGRGDQKKAQKAANVSLFLCLCYTVAALAGGLLLARRFYTMQTDVRSIVDYGEQYLRIVCVWSLGSFTCQIFEKLLVSTGNATASMIAQSVGAVTNIILDPILIFGLGPIPALGVRGAAIATVLGQWCAALIGLALNLRYNHTIRFDLRQILPTREIVGSIYAVGIPSMIMIGLNAVMNFFMNAIMLTFSTTAAAVLGVWMKLQSFGFMPVFGMNNGTLAIFSYNHGARKIDRVFRTLRISLMLGVCITAAVALLYELIPVPLLGLFSASDYMLSIGVPAIRILAVGMIFGAACVVLSSASQALGHPLWALIISLCRQVVILLPAAWMLSLSRRLELVWISQPIAEILSLVVAVVFVRRLVAELRAQRTEAG